MSRNEGTGRMWEASRLSVAEDVVHQPTDEYTSETEKSQTMKGNIMDDKIEDEPLFKGGFGHSDKEIEDSALGCTVCLFGLFVIVGIYGVMALIAKFSA